MLVGKLLNNKFDCITNIYLMFSMYHILCSDLHVLCMILSHSSYEAATLVIPVLQMKLRLALPRLR